jgi:hypothetical protein
MNKVLVITMASVFFAFAPALATIIQVPGDYPTIQEGIDHSSPGDTVLVFPGTYVENVDFGGRSIVLASTFMFTEDQASIENTIIDGAGAYTTVSIQSGEDFSTRLIGFSIRNGLGTGDWPNVRGGGVHISGNATPTIEHCYIFNNMCIGSSNRGAGIYANSANSSISHCRIYNNESDGGAAIAVGNYSNLVEINNCNIFDNTSTSPFSNNQSIIAVNYSSGVMISRTIVHNNAGSGVRNFGSSETALMHCTISNNSSWGVYNTYFDSDVQIRNSIIAFHEMGSIMNETYGGLYNCWVLGEYSDLLDGFGYEWFGEGCIDIDPSFVDTLQHNYNLNADSPCIDAGDPSSPPDPDGTRADMGALFYDQRPQLDLFPHDPPIVVPPEGGSFTYDGRLVNRIDSPVRVDVWTMAILPNSQPYGPIRWFPSLQLAPFDTLTALGIPESVPGSAPPGSYLYIGYVGQYGTTVYDSSYFEVTKLE